MIKGKRLPVKGSEAQSVEGIYSLNGSTILYPAVDPSIDNIMFIINVGDTSIATDGEKYWSLVSINGNFSLFYPKYFRNPPSKASVRKVISEIGVK